MNTDFQKFVELSRTDEEFQNKLKVAAESYTGEQTEEAVFENVLVPFASGYGISATYDEFKEYIANLAEQELNSDEIVQVAGGGPKGFGATMCTNSIGIGGGATGSNDGGGACVLIGTGDGTLVCIGAGE